jgi:two-component system capsular synthesis response regulator RcsB
MLRIGLADDHPVIMDALESAFVEAGGFSVVFKARTGAQLIEALRAQPCDAVVTDYSMTQGMSGGDGLALIAQLLRQFPTVRVIVFTMLANPALCEQLAALGVHGIVSKSDDRAEVLAAMRALSAGGKPPILSPGVRASIGTRRNGAPQPLSQRETDVVRLFAQGHSLDEIATSLNRAKTTVATHKQNAMQKLGLTSNAELVRYAYELGIA